MVSTISAIRVPVESYRKIIRGLIGYEKLSIGQSWLRSQCWMSKACWGLTVWSNNLLWLWDCHGTSWQSRSRKSPTYLDFLIVGKPGEGQEVSESRKKAWPSWAVVQGVRKWLKLKQLIRWTGGYNESKEQLRVVENFGSTGRESLIGKRIFITWYSNRMLKGALPVKIKSVKCPPLHCLNSSTWL